MSTEEGSGLMTKETPESIVNSCIDNADIQRIRWITFGLAIGNAADAVEILCVGMFSDTDGDYVCMRSGIVTFSRVVITLRTV